MDAVIATANFSTWSAVTQISTAFLAGLAASLTPCVYPLIPVTLAIFSAGGERSRRQALLSAALYGVGLCFTFTALGVAASATGALFATALSETYAAVAFSLLLVLMAASIIGIVPFTILSRLAAVTVRFRGGGAFVLGALSGAAAAPCTGPVLVAVLALAAKSQSAAWGAVLLFTYALGANLLLVVLALCAPAAAGLPKPGPWMDDVKIALATALLVGAILSAQPILPAIELLRPTVLAAAAWLSAAVLLCLPAVRRRRGKVVGAATALLIAIGFWISAECRTPVVSSGPAWRTQLDAALTEAQDLCKPLIVDFFAKWCVACRQLHKETFSDPRVIRRLEKFIPVKIDISVKDVRITAIMKRYGVRGVPCLLFLTNDGTEIPGSRLEHFISAADFTSTLDRILGQTVTDCRSH